MCVCAGTGKGKTSHPRWPVGQEMNTRAGPSASDGMGSIGHQVDDGGQSGQQSLRSHDVPASHQPAATVTPDTAVVGIIQGGHVPKFVAQRSRFGAPSFAKSTQQVVPSSLAGASVRPAEAADVGSLQFACMEPTLVPRTLLWGTAHPRNPCDPTSFHRAD